jgi:hypothetical protein
MFYRVMQTKLTECLFVKILKVDKLSSWKHSVLNTEFVLLARRDEISNALYLSVEHVDITYFKSVIALDISVLTA